MKKLGIYLAFLLGFAALAQAETLPALYDVTGVGADDMLNIRAAPNANSDVLGQLAPQATGVEVTAQSPDGRWGRVNSAETSGWASLHYLTRQPGPDWTALTRPMICSGTEPFWTLSIDPQPGILVLEEIDGTPINLSVEWHAPAQGLPGVVGLALHNPDQTGFATLQAAECSDGMSDRLSGISLSLFLRGNGAGDAGQGYSGCCSLSP